MIWVPKNLYGEGSNTWEFPDITTAIDALKAIYYLGDINWENITKAWWGFIDNSAAEVKMQEIWILWKNWGFSLTKAQDILKQWWYIQEAANDRLYDENMTDINQFRTNNQNNNFTQEHSSNVEEIIWNNKKKSDQDNVLPFTWKTEPNINIADDLLEEKKAE